MSAVKWRWWNIATQVTKDFLLLSAFSQKCGHAKQKFTVHRGKKCLSTLSYRIHFIAIGVSWTCFILSHNCDHLIHLSHHRICFVPKSSWLHSQTLKAHNIPQNDVMKTFLPGASERRVPCQPQDEVPQWRPSHPFSVPLSLLSC